MNLNLTEIINLINHNKFHESLNLINKLENNHKENFDLINIKGFVFLRLYEFEKAIDYLTKALQQKKDSFLTLCYRSAAYSEMGDYEKALADLKNANSIEPDSHKILFSIGQVYSNLGNNNKAIEYFLKSIENKDDFDEAIEYIIIKLSEINTFKKDNNKFIETNLLINKIQYDYSHSKKIEESTIKSIFDKANTMIEKKFKNLKTSQTQTFRRNRDLLNCDRHFIVFNKFQAIPKFCFSCFKVTIELQNVIDLIKLYLIFENISLTRNNIRKCMIESRADVKGNYKGFIYCNSLEEAKTIQKQLKTLIEKNISSNFVPEIKRGCSEFGMKYPKYKDYEHDSMEYEQNWSKFENIVDKKFPKFLSNKKNRETSKGINLRDILIIKNWLLFAKLIGDDSYKRITNEKLVNGNIDKQFLNKIESINNNQTKK